MNKATILKNIEIGINNLKQEEVQHFSHVASKLMNSYTSKTQQAIVFFFDTELDEVELIPINADENETNKLLSFIINLQRIDRPYDS